MLSADMMRYAELHRTAGFKFRTQHEKLALTASHGVFANSPIETALTASPGIGQCLDVHVFVTDGQLIEIPRGHLDRASQQIEVPDENVRQISEYGLGVR